jgi:hypothetical protein
MTRNAIIATTCTGPAFVAWLRAAMVRNAWAAATAARTDAERGHWLTILDALSD